MVATAFAARLCSTRIAPGAGIPLVNAQYTRDRLAVLNDWNSLEHMYLVGGVPR